MCVSISDIRNLRRSSAWLYEGLGARTIARDINVLTAMDLILIQDGLVRANIEVTDIFTPDTRD